MCQVVLFFYEASCVSKLSVAGPSAPGARCNGRTQETIKESEQRSAARIDWPSFSSLVEMWSQKRAYEPNRMFEIASCAHCNAQIDGRSTRRTSEKFGVVGR